MSVGAGVGITIINLIPGFRGQLIPRGLTHLTNRRMIRKKLAMLIPPKAFGVASLAIALVVLPGCSKGGPSKSISSSAFDSAPADIKQCWNDGIAGWKNRHYAEAATNFVSLQSKAGTLSTQQAEALTKAVDEFGQEAFEAANKGDAGATEAVKALRGSGRRSHG